MVGKTKIIIDPYSCTVVKRYTCLLVCSKQNPSKLCHSCIAGNNKKKWSSHHRGLVSCGILYIKAIKCYGTRVHQTLNFGIVLHLPKMNEAVQDNLQDLSRSVVWTLTLSKGLDIFYENAIVYHHIFNKTLWSSAVLEYKGSYCTLPSWSANYQSH